MNTVLVIEPDASFKDNLVELLTLEGYAVKGVSNITDAAMALNRFNPSVVICDGSLLNDEFTKLHNEFKKNLDTSSVKVIVIDGTGQKFEETDAYITMPFRDEELLAKLSSLKELRRV